MVRSQPADRRRRLVKKKARNDQETRWIRSGSRFGVSGDCDQPEPLITLPRPETVRGTVVSVPSPSAARTLDSTRVRVGLGRARRAVDRHAAALTRLDAVLGDGDHGDNLSTGFRAVEALLDELPPETPPGELLRAVGYRLVATVGGASGPLFGTAFIEAGFRAGDAER